MVIQRNVRKYLQLRNWLWFKMYSKVKPLLSLAKADEEMKQKEEEAKAMMEKFESIEKANKEFEEKVRKEPANYFVYF